MKKEDRVSFNKFFGDFVEVLTRLDDYQVLSVEIPKSDKFFENDPKQITTHFLEYLDKSGKKIKSDISVSSKFKGHDYESIYQIYHDLKIASIIRYSENEDFEEECHNIDRFFQVATEILLKESLRLENSTDHHDKDLRKSTRGESRSRSVKQEFQDSDDPRSELRRSIVRDFELITTSYLNKSGSALILSVSNGVPIFSSLSTTISELEDKQPHFESDAPAENLTVVPTLKSLTAEDLIQLSPGQGPTQQLSPPTEILVQNFHPNWYSIPVPQWLKHGDNENDYSFAPMFDEAQSIISNEWKGIMWLQQYGLKRISEIKRSLEAEEMDQDVPDDIQSEAQKLENGNGTSEDPEFVLQPQADPQVGLERDSSEVLIPEKDRRKSHGHEEGEVEEEEQEQEMEEEHGHEGQDDDDVDIDIDIDSAPINLENLLQWKFGEIIEDSEESAVEAQIAQQTITELLLELNQLRRQRFLDGKHSNSRVFKPNKVEVVKFHQLKRMLSGLIKHKNVLPNQLGMKPSTKIPILQQNYNGSLPSSMMSDAHNSQAVQISAYNRPGRRRR
ncbi:hypothetical protein OGAPHI_002307 [Ogataea philodendri]|uniref:Chromatin structure-remodeling complex protein RSC58 n=1 Tax=Ogataea philodendri TaxID=1378263 RepID=A0A9P8T6X3_9ASCO|nr:uncharacterized protein OGAPHI_002307 [Ogataea philodendri]KAH3668553.1 hypothetical protein OGAPHI_002307 [Ogataea philodendri]